MIKKNFESLIAPHGSAHNVREMMCGISLTNNLHDAMSIILMWHKNVQPMVCHVYNANVA